MKIVAGVMMILAAVVLAIAVFCTIAAIFCIDENVEEIKKLLKKISSKQ